MNNIYCIGNDLFLLIIIKTYFYYEPTTLFLYLLLKTSLAFICGRDLVSVIAQRIIRPVYKNGEIRVIPF